VQLQFSVQRVTRLAWAFVAIQIVCMPVWGQAIDDVDRSAVEKRFTGSVNIHNTNNRFPDGAKGWVKGTSNEARGGPIPGGAKARAKIKASWNYCYCDAIVLAEYVNSNPPGLTKSKGAIYTVSHFKVSQVIKGSQLTPGQTILSYRAGGEVEDDGELLRIDTPDAPPYKVGQTYLLMLERDKTASKLQYHVADEGTTVVTGARVYPSIPGQLGFLPGTTIADVLADFAQAANSSPPSQGCKPK
jgi:hypothetical protein